MTETSLRTYTRDIDRLIEQEKLDEAIAHCRHILQNYPKYIECYRLLGKAYLEAKRYGDAADIFQRVLSAVPDDFVSHIGMSIVREDEGNLESSIWHMERAFETNPANPALQQELKRLIGRRDGFEPHKVRLTRGALARMYAHGELYPQAIAELQSALQEESDRPDLQILLADMFWQTDQRMEAAEVAGQILDKLPFCLKALRITAAILQERGKQEEAGAYHRRLAQLDPYLAYIEMPMAESTRVDADTIVIDKLSWQPGQPLPAAEGGPADWAASLGLDEQGGAGPGTGPLPSWLSDIEMEEEGAEAGGAATEEPAALPFDSPEAATEGESAAAADIPDWMQDAGWSEATGEAQEGPVSFSAEELDSLERGELPSDTSAEADTGELEPAEIPSWLQEKAPEQAEPGGDTGDEDEAELAAILGASVEEDQPEPAEATEAPEPSEAGAEVPAWLDEGEPGATSTIMSWLGDREAEGESPESDEGELPDWILENTPGGPSSPTDEQADEGVPAWLSGVAQAAAEAGESEEQELEQFRQQREPEIGEEPEPSRAGDVPDWLQAITGEEPEQPDQAESIEAAPEEAAQAPRADAAPQAEAAPDWLAGLGDESEEQSGAEAVGAVEPAEEHGEQKPAEADAASWLEALGSDESAIRAQEQPEAIPDWMAGLGEESGSPSDEEVEDLADTWLEGLSETLAGTPAEPTSTSEPLAADIPDWLGEMAEDEAEEAATPATEGGQLFEGGASEEEEEDLSWLTELESQVSTEESATSERPRSAADLDELAEEDVFNWLDQLAAGQEAGEGLGDQVAEQGSGAGPELSETAPPESLEEGLEWLDKLSESRGIDADISRQPAAGTPSEAAGMSESAPSPTGEDVEAELFNVWEPEAPEEPEPTGPEQAPSADLGEERQEEQPAAEEPTSIFDEVSVAGWEREEQQAEELPAADEMDFELAPPPESIFSSQEEEELEEAAEPADLFAESEALAEEPEPLAATEEPVGSASEEPEPSAEEEEVPDWLKAHFDAAAVDEAEPTEAMEPEPEPEPEAFEQAEVHELPQEPIVPKSEIPEAAEQAAEPMSSLPEAASQEMEIQEPTPASPAEAAAPPTPEAAELTAEEPEAEAGAPEPAESPPAEPVPAAEPEAALPVPPEEPVEIETEPEAEPAPEPEPLDATLVAAREALAEGDQSAALANYNRLIKGKRQLDHVIADIEAALEDDPDAPALWQALGDAYMRQGRTKQAVQAYNRGMEEAEVLDNARQALAIGDLDRATAQYGMLIKSSKRLDEIITDLENAVEGEQPAAAIWQLLGDAYMKADRLNESIDAYRRGMESV